MFWGVLFSFGLLVGPSISHSDPHDELKRDALRSFVHQVLPAAAPAIQTEASSIFVNRRLFKSSDALMHALLNDLVEKRPNPEHRWVLFLDFNVGPEIFSDLNIVNPSISEKIGHRKFFSLTPEERGQQIYEPYFKRITDPNFNGVIHIDHHYPFPVLGDVSTTVLTGEFLLWIHEHHPRHRILNQISEGFGLVDHADPDILLAQMLTAHAHEESFIRKYQSLLADIALLNDHLKAPSGTSVYRKRVYDLFEILLDFETEVRDQGGSFARALLEATQSLENPDFVRLQRQRAFTAQTRARIRAILATALHREGEVLVIQVPDSEPISELSAVLLFLLTEDDSLLRGARVAIASLPNPDSHRRFLKMRSLDGTDLNPLYSRLGAQGLEAGGRASAGSVAYGKAGSSMRDTPQEKFKRDLDSALKVIQDYLKSLPQSASVCNGLVQTNPE